MFCIKTIVLMTLGFFVSFSIFRISYQTGKDNDAAGWEISGFGGSRNVENSQVYRHLERLPFRAMAETSLFYWAVYAGKILLLTSDRRSLYNRNTISDHWSLQGGFVRCQKELHLHPNNRQHVEAK